MSNFTCKSELIYIVAVIMYCNIWAICCNLQVVEAGKAMLRSFQSHGMVDTKPTSTSASALARFLSGASTTAAAQHSRSILMYIH